MLLQNPAPAAPPPAPGTPVVQGGGTVQVLIDGKPMNATPAQLFKAAENQRDQLGSQMDRLKEERSDIANRLGGHAENNLSAADKAGLEKRLTVLDGRIEQLDNQIAAADAQVAAAAAIPGAIVEPPPFVRHGPPEEVFVLGGIFMFVAILPISLAYARRIWRRSAAAVSALPHDIVERFTQIDQAVESIAVEVERIGEGQRFITRVLSEQGRPALAEPAARGVEVRARPNG